MSDIARLHFIASQFLDFEMIPPSIDRIFKNIPWELDRSCEGLHYADVTNDPSVIEQLSGVAGRIDKLLEDVEIECLEFAPNCKLQRHLHFKSDSVVFVPRHRPGLLGYFPFSAGAWVPLASGQVVSAPRQVEHGFWNKSGVPVRLLAFATPPIKADDTYARPE